MHLTRAALAAGILCLAIAVLGTAAFVLAPLPSGLTDYGALTAVRILDRSGGLLRELRSRPDGRSMPVPLERIPPHVRAAFLAAEDHRFYGHPGVSGLALARAAVHDLQAGRFVEGGSTLTQQLARMLVPRPRTLLGKVQEALWALRLEAHLGKDEILAQYLNRVPLGNGAFGVEAAAQLYFGRSAQHLSIAQAAALASLPRAPSAYDPRRAARRLAPRQQWVLQRMVAIGALAPELATRAGSEPLDLADPERVFRAPHATTAIAENLERWGLGDAAAVHTTIDPALQAFVEQTVTEELASLKGKRVGSAAVLVVDNLRGEVLAYLGSADFFDEAIQGQNDGVRMRRQPGSALKPFAYAEALRDGLTPASVLADVEVTFPSPQGAYAPRNYDNRTHGPVRLREALANSDNIPAVRVAERLGPARLLSTLRAAGFESLELSPEHYGLGLVLGNGEVSLWELARAYAGLSRGGIVEPLRLVQRALQADGRELAVPPELRPRRFATPASSALVADILSDNAARSRSFGLDSVLELPFPAAAKTGTSKGYSDNWTVGFTRERTVAVWTGNFDRTPMVQVSGVAGAGPIFHRVMVRAMAGLSASPLVDASLLEEARICPLSGARAGPDCPSAMRELFARGHVSEERCAMHGRLGEKLPDELRAQCLDASGPGGRLLDVGAEFQAWARAEGLSREPWLAAACAQAKGSGSLAIASPRPGDEFLRLSDLPSADQGVPLRVVADPSETALEVWIDGARWGPLPPPFTAQLPASPGVHALAIRRQGDAQELASTRYRVRLE